VSAGSDASAESDGLTYRVSREGELDELTLLIADTFAREDPLALATGLTAGEIEAYIRAVLRSPEVPALTMIARDPTSGDMAGALLAEDASNPPPEASLLSARLDPLYALFGTLASRLPAPIVPVAGQDLHLLMLAVSRRFAGRGTGQRLVAACMVNGGDHGFRTAVTEATGPVSQHVFGKLGFETEAEVAYADFRHDGRAPFASIADLGCIKAMARDIEVVSDARDIHQR
jgi:ribosomal protein S18 acetylase RimI-like enzyme